MDLVTQGLLGGVVGQALCQRKLGPKAIVWGTLVGLFPDADIIAVNIMKFYSADPLLMHKVHRGLSHSLFFACVICVPLGYMIAVIDDYWQRRRHIFITTPVASHKTVWMRLCFWALITHPLLDLFTSFGTQLLLPFSSHRFALSAIPIIDLVYSVPLLLSIIWGLWVRWQAAAIGCVTLFATTCYLFLGLAQHDIALEHVQNYCASKQLACHKIEAYPLLPTIFAHRLVAFAGDTMHISEFSSWTGEVKPWVKFAHTPLPESLRSDARLQTYHWFTKGIWLGHISAPYTFCMFDARYGSLSHQPRGLFNMCIKGDETFINLSDFEASFNKLGFMAKCRRFIQYGLDVYRWALGLQA